MFDVLVYLYENYYRPDACPDADTLARKLSAAGFEGDEIDSALSWLSRLATVTQTTIPVAYADSSSFRIYVDVEYERLTRRVHRLPVVPRVGRRPESRCCAKSSSSARSPPTRRRSRSSRCGSSC